MSELVVVTYPDINRAAEVLVTLKRLEKEHLIDLEDAVYVTKDADGKVKLHQSVPLGAIGASSGMIRGTIWGTLIGLLFLNPLLGALTGAAAGAAGGAISGSMIDYGISDDFIKELGEQLQPNTSALFLLVKKSTPDKVLPEVSQYGGKILRSSLSNEQEQKLQEALDAGAAGAATPAAQPAPPATAGA